MASDQQEQPKPQRKRGRPKGAKNKTPRIAQGKRIASRKPPQDPPAPKPAGSRGQPQAQIDKDRVKELARQALPLQYIADLIGVSKDTLKKHCGHELKQGYAEAVERVNTLSWAMATENSAVLLHLRKVLMGENDKLEIVGEQQKYVLVIDKLEND